MDNSQQHTLRNSLVSLQCLSAAYYLLVAFGAAFGDHKALGGPFWSKVILATALLGAGLFLATAWGVLRSARWTAWTIWLSLIPISAHSLIAILAPLQIAQAILYHKYLADPRHRKLSSPLRL